MPASPARPPTRRRPGRAAAVALALVALALGRGAGQSRSLPDGRFAEMWAAFDAVVAAPLRAAGIAYAATMGNHDASKLRDADGGHAFARERQAAAAYWRQAHHLAGLTRVDGADQPFAWSFRLGPLFVAVIDASGPVVDDAERAGCGAATSRHARPSPRSTWRSSRCGCASPASTRPRCCPCARACCPPGSTASAGR